MKEELYSNALYYYGSRKAVPYTLSMRMVLNDPVDGDALQTAVSRTMERYAYIKRRVRRNFNKFWLEENPLPVVVLPSDQYAVLGSEEVNYHLLAFRYAENMIFIDCFHGHLDGSFLSRLMGTLLYYYVEAHYGETMDPKGLSLLGDEISKTEYEDPFPRKIVLTEKPLQRTPRFIRNFKMGKGKKHGPEYRRTFSIQASEEQVMACCRRMDASPSVFAALVMAKVIDRVHPENKRPISIGNAFNIRPVLHAENCYRSTIYALHLLYDERVRRLPENLQGTALRGQIMLQSDPTSVMAELKFQNKVYKLNAALPFLFMKKLVARASTGLENADTTFTVSYAGKVDMGDAGRYIKKFDAQGEGGTAGLLIEVYCINGMFIFSIFQDYEDTEYVDTFIELLRSNGVDARLVSVTETSSPGIKF